MFIEQVASEPRLPLETPVIAVDPRLCIGCKACEVACEREHGGVSHINVHFIERLKSFVALNCRHCAKAPCVTVCPVNACKRTPEGAVVIDPMLCIGCRLCGIVCPFGVPEYDPQRKIMVKCDLCLHRIREGKEPACATTCPTDALKYVPSYATLTASRREEAAEKLIRAVQEMEKLLKPTL